MATGEHHGPASQQGVALKAAAAGVEEEGPHSRRGQFRDDTMLQQNATLISLLTEMLKNQAQQIHTQDIRLQEAMEEQRAFLSSLKNVSAQQTGAIDKIAGLMGGQAAAIDFIARQASHAEEGKPNVLFPQHNTKYKIKETAWTAGGIALGSALGVGIVAGVAALAKALSGGGTAMT